ncbi:MG2 domain-containing protein [Flavobacterium sp. J27]|uniref:alpha-2-macroglobulin family protein n=1 Tax=Flavobacterium sp. J27 TaxID=2060419 RepID=UPI00103089B7|nr:MG2 domain-containing protein [Flavobacterium sp. J27]
MLLFSQNNFDKDWREVYQYEIDGKTNSAYEGVQNIYKKAKKKKDNSQIIKTFFYISKFTQELEEDAQSKIISNLNKEITKAKGNSKAILQYIYATILKDYFNKNRYQINKRTPAEKEDETNFQLWSSHKINLEIEKNYLNCISNPPLLQEQNILNYKDILIISPDIDGKNYNLYDLLWNKCIEYYKNNFTTWDIKKSDFEEHKIKKFYAQSDTFIEVSTKEITLPNFKKTIELLQEYEQYYLHDTHKNNEAHLKRLNYIHSVFEDNLSYFQQLKKLESKVDSIFLLQEIKINKANYLYSITSKNSEENHYNEILKICDSVLQKKNNHNALAEAEKIKNKILQKSLHVETKRILYEKEPSRAFLTYKNIDTVTIHYFKIPKSFDLSKNVLEKNTLVSNFISKNKPVISFTRKLPNPKKYFEYTTEILLEPMPIGDYLIVIQPNNLELQNNNYEYTRITVSNISFVKDSDGQNDYFYVSDRKTGKPLQNIIVKNDEETKKPNVLGKVSFRKKKYDKSKNMNADCPIFLIQKGDTLAGTYKKGFFFKEKDTKSFDDSNEAFQAKAKVYFDRAIYRPGQKVFYKGILIQNKKNIKSIVPFVTVLVTIEDSDYNILKEYEVQTNEFGSFSGEFDIPKNVLTGQFKLIVDEPDTYENDKKYYNKKEEEHAFWDIVNYNYDNEFTFQVEEYKRPTFEVTFETIKENYTIGDTLKIVGNAKSLAGSSLTNAKVNYTISRNSYANTYDSNSERKNIGSIETDSKGNFTIQFIANDNLLGNNQNTELFYTIEVDVVDNNGETRAASKKIVVGKEMLKLELNSYNRIFYKEEDNYIKITATTLNDYPIETKGNLYISIVEAKSFLKNRQFEIPETQTISEHAFRLFFPHEPYDKNDSKTSEKVLKVIPFDTAKEKIISLNFFKKLENGNYKIVAKALDKNNNEIIKTNYFELKSNKNNFDKNALFTFKDITNPKNDYFEFEFQSVIPDLYIFSRFYTGTKLTQEEAIQLQNNKGTLKIKKENYTNNEDFFFHFSALYDNTTLEKKYSISKEIVNKKLEFEIISLRNKIEPSSKEIWSFKIINSQLETEVLASMYDSSLDQFKQHEWDSNLHFNTSYHSPNYPSFYNYNKSYIYFNKFSQSVKHYNYYIKEPDLNYFGFNFENPNNVYSKEKYLKSIQPLTTIPKNAKTVTGTISDMLGPLASASITVQGTKRNTITDFDGNFSIQAEPGEILTISYIGMIDFYYTVKTKNDNINITLENNETDLKEVVVVAYGIQREKKTLGYAVTVIEDTIPQDSKFLSYLSGQVAGVEVQQNLGSTPTIRIRGYNSIGNDIEPLYIVDGAPVTSEEFSKLRVGLIGNYTLLKDASATALYGNKAAGGAIIVTTKKALKEVTQVKTRTNFNETAFFYPDLKTDKEGKISFNFSTPESLTRWKLRLLGHNKNFETAYFQSDIVSQKDLMVMPNLPRFVREKDTITLVSKIVNMTNETKAGIAMLLLFDPTNGTAIDSMALNLNNHKNFICKPKESVAVSWTIAIPEDLQGLQYKIVAQSGNFSDGEENILPVLSNKILITETIPVWVKEHSKKVYVLENLKNNTSSTLQNHKITFEYTSNPVWFAIQALPYLMEFEHECAEQTFSRYYANTIATEIIAKNPKIATLFESYRNEKRPDAKLKINEELKSILLAETPWFFENENVNNKNKQLAYLFDINTLEQNKKTTLQKLNEKLGLNGGFPWFDGGEVNLFITQHILAGIGHLNQLFPNQKANYNAIVSKSIPFIDQYFLENFETNRDNFKHYSFSDIHYLYTRSFFLKDLPFSSKLPPVIQEQLTIIKENWLTYSLYQKAQLALIFNRFGDIKMAKKILTHLKETASLNNEIGMHWIENKTSWYWYQSPIETQALLIEAFHEVNQDEKTIDQMKVWLLKNKQSKNWKTTKATTEAIYALLLRGTEWTSIKGETQFKIGNEKMNIKKLNEQEKESEIGYLKLNWKAPEISKEMAEISIENQSKIPGYGGIYWQYFETLENIKESNNKALLITKKLFKKEQTTTGIILKNIDDKSLKIGDIVTVQLSLQVFEDIEYIHLKDVRASCFEPIDVLSKQEWNDNLHYYKSTKDVATHFFFDKINKGYYILEYDVRVNNSGVFNDGIATIQSMYAPEFSAHSKNNIVKVMK